MREKIDHLKAKTEEELKSSGHMYVTDTHIVIDQGDHKFYLLKQNRSWAFQYCIQVIIHNREYILLCPHEGCNGSIWSYLATKAFGSGNYGRPRIKCNTCGKTSYVKRKYYDPESITGKNHNIERDH